MRLVATVLALCAVAACNRAPRASAERSDITTIASGPAIEAVPPAAPVNGMPLAEAGDLEGQPPFEQAKAFKANGQLWMARLVLEPKALGSDGTKEEAELLGRICSEQKDAACVEACGKKLGRKIKFDAGDSETPAARPVGDRGEPDTDLTRARDLLLKNQLEPARKTLEPKALDGKASREEVRMLRTICEKQRDRMCIALCDAKLK